MTRKDTPLLNNYKKKIKKITPYESANCSQDLGIWARA